MKSIFDAIRRLFKLERHASPPMTKAHAAILDDIEMVLKLDRTAIEVLTPEIANIRLEKLEAVMRGEIGDRKWGLHEALKAKAQK